MAKETAEEKLLKMLQKSGAPVSAPGATAASVKPKQKLAFSFSIRLLNQILFIGIICCLAGLVYEMRSGMELISKDINFSDDAKSASAIADMAMPSGKDAKYYLEKISSRNIFRPYEATAKNPAVLNLTKRLAKFKLVGVAWLDLPESATIMIEDTQTKVMYFLKKGEQVEGVTVKTIYTDRAVFSYEHEETTIKL